MRKRYRKRTKNEVKCFQISSFYDLSLDSRRTALKETGKFCNVSGNDAAMDMIRKNRYFFKFYPDGTIFHEPTGKPVGLIFKINLIGTTCKTDRISLALSE